jgi:hypothetical protein
MVHFITENTDADLTVEEAILGHLSPAKSLESTFPIWLSMAP